MNREINIRYYSKDINDNIFTTEYEMWQIESLDTPMNVFARALYTGLKDKNGVEIYEGDIVDVNQTVNGRNIFYIQSCLPKLDVRYGFDLDYKYEYDAYSLLDYKTKFGGESEIEVIGNIYENPELLK